jgi:mono/diheme cytochrome c family protein
MMCHGMSGGGLPGQFPPLKGSELVMGPESRLARILLHGLEGPVVVNGTTYDMPMAPAPVNEDQEIAALMTFIRRSFGNNAEPVATQTITRIREATKDRQSSWTIEELKAIP